MRMLVPFLGCIADDITGATDLGSALVRRGLSTVQIFGVPNPDDAAGDEDAVVVALKTRTLPSPAAREQALRSLRWLQTQNIAHVYFKYCSTFDSTSAGNIGPVTDELLTALDGSQVIHCPAYPTNGRTLYRGHLFVGRSLLSESGMQDHPLTPMRDPNLVRVLGAQTPAAVDLLPLQTLQAGPEATGRLLEELARRGVRHIIADAIADAHVDRIAAAAAGMALLGGGAPLGAAWGAVLARAVGGVEPAPPSLPGGPAAVLVGSASRATARQVEKFARHWPVRRLVSTEELSARPDLIDAVLDWARVHLADGPILITADTRPEAVGRAQTALGRDVAAAVVEQAMGRLAAGLAGMRVGRLVVAGGETSGAVAEALGIRRVRIGPEICTGVPWTVSTDPDVALAFKSGNFGGVDFFREALACSPTSAPTDTDGGAR